MHALILTMLLAADPDPTPRFDAKLAKKEDTFSAKLVKGATVWTVTSASGIGMATVTLAKGEAPKKVTILFPRLRNLSSFIVYVGGLEAGCTLGETVRIDAKGNKTDKAEDAALTVAVGKGKDVIEAVVQTKEPAKSWRLDWIDDYRK